MKSRMFYYYTSMVFLVASVIVLGLTIYNVKNKKAHCHNVG